LGTDWAQVERAAAETLLRLAAAGEPVPGSVLDVLGVDDGEFQIRRGIERARAVLNMRPAIDAASVPKSCKHHARPKSLRPARTL
jgi:hypothetical protein